MIKNIAITLSLLLVIVLVAGYLYVTKNGLVPRHAYETVAPELPEFSRPTILIFNKTNGFIHHETIPVSDGVLTGLAEQLGWDVYITNNAAVHNSTDLQKFKMVIWNNTSGDVLTEIQRRDFKSWLEGGGAWLGLHAAGGDTEYPWNWYVDVLLGAQFIGHTMEPQFQDADLYPTGEARELTGHLPAPWNVKQEEWYAFDQSPRGKGYEILLTIDEGSYITKGKTKYDFVDSMKGEHPLVWRHELGKGKVFYSAIGHRPATYNVPEYRELIRKAMSWAAE